VAARLLHAILRKAGARAPFAMGARDFNAAAEAYYREDLRLAQLGEAVDLLANDLAALGEEADRDECLREALRAVVGEARAEDCLARRRDDLMAERLPVAELQRLIHVVLLSVEADTQHAEGPRDGTEQRALGEPAPVR